MRKMPCLFVRRFEGNRIADITAEVSPGCEWVARREGVATRKWDGTACLVREGALFARYDAKRGKTPPPGAIPCDPEPDPVTGHWPHWVEVLDQPQFKWHREAWESAQIDGSAAIDGTYELVGPAINNNREKLERHQFRKHGDEVLDAPRSFEDLREWLRDFRGEGIVFHHPDGRMSKIRRNDFGFGWPP